jgi:DNA modification methylase
MAVTDSSLIQKGKEKQLLDDGSIHRWYRFVLAFPDCLVTEMCERFNVAQSDIVLDPFCGTGTTLVECQKMGLNAVGLEANPACVFASRIKTTWDIDIAHLRVALEKIVERAQPICDELTFSAQPLFAGMFNAGNLKKRLLANSPEGQYFVSSGMLKRKWLSEIPFYKVLALLEEIKGLEDKTKVQDALRLALAAILVETASNVSFGPEIYVSGHKDDVDVLGAFRAKVEVMISDLETIQATFPAGRSLVLSGDARECACVLAQNDVQPVDFVITSPPYPTEKDYTRQTRLELVFLGYVHDTESLRRIKRAMVRSHSKGIYKSDNDGQWVANVPEVRAIADELRVKIRDKTYGFAKLYPRIIEEYFGGMYRHLRSLNETLISGGRCAYVVGDQRTYLQTFTPTGKILGILAEQIGFQVEDALIWRVRKGTTGSGKEIKEQIVILRKP